jgi:hypothetical protein
MRTAAARLVRLEEISRLNASDFERSAGRIIMVLGGAFDLPLVDVRNFLTGSGVAVASDDVLSAAFRRVMHGGRAR